jgi:DNA polymerase-3 subunit epsilon
MRQIVLDTETTGLEPAAGHRIIEIGCVELVNRRPTSNRFHRYINPEREVDRGALEVHGIENDFLATQPKFAEVAAELVEFIQGAELVIHNADFDVEFLNHELRRLPGLPHEIRGCCGVLDTLALARKLHPGQRNSLDALAKRYSVDNSKRELHGALLDAQILAEIYLAMTGGQVSLSLEASGVREAETGAAPLVLDRRGLELVVATATAEEERAHEALLAVIAKKAPPIWRELEREVDRGALEVHGIENDFLATQPKFAEVAAELVEFIQGAERVIHKAGFDVEFLNHELRRLPGLPHEIRGCCGVLDTLALARKLHPGQRNSLDALAKRYSVDNSKRELHGALLDAQILAEIYLAMTGGQVSLSLESSGVREAETGAAPLVLDRRGLELVVVTATAEEERAHEALLAVMAKKGPPIWRELEREDAARAAPAAA